jgi:hypothetical protein
MERNRDDLPGPFGQLTTQLGVTAARRDDLEAEGPKSCQYLAR